MGSGWAFGVFFGKTVTSVVILLKDDKISLRSARDGSLRRTGVTELTREIDHLESTVARLKPKKFDGDS